jgi:adenine-specific DNA-methyltransferase
MLTNGLGDALNAAMVSANRIFDLFSGSGAVASHIAQNFEKEVFAGD